MPTPRPPQLDTFLVRVASLGERVRTDEAALLAASNDEAGLEPGLPSAVLFPRAVEEVVLVAREAASLAVPLVPRGGGTGKAGACIPRQGEVVVDLSRMNRILSLRPQDLYAVVEPGLITRELDRAASEHGLMYPPDPSSWESCTLGGNIATNAGGPRAVKYGVTQRYVWGLQLVLPGGDVLQIGKRSLKGVVGLDLTSLLVGSEGTLGFITEATLHVVPAPPSVETAWLSFSEMGAASRTAERIFGAGLMPRMLEVIDAQAIEVVRDKVAFEIPREARACLLLEADGREDQAMGDLMRMCELGMDAGALDGIVAKNDKERDNLRRGRRLVSPSLKAKYPYKLSDDVAVPRSAIVHLLELASREAAQAGLTFAAYGHLGDGNIHVNLLAESEAARVAAHAVRVRVMQHVLALGGTMSGEHGVGLCKRDELPLEQSREVIALQRRLKAAFDPAGIMNPGKVWPTL